MKLLVFTLAAPLMSFGGIAPGELRVSWDRPGRSALAGLTAAALGLTREDDRQEWLAASVAFAVRVDAPGRHMVDYHTTQTAPTRKDRQFATRREELAASDLTTILSQRSYLEDAAFTIAALVEDGGPFTIEEIAQVLEQPRFSIHVGRRCCPPGLPLSPLVVEAPSLGGAFAAYDAEQARFADRAELRSRFIPSGARRALCAVDPRFEALRLLSDVAVERRETRRDDPVSRVRWQFARREQIVGRLMEMPQ